MSRSSELPLRWRIPTSQRRRAMVELPFQDRAEAGRVLGAELAARKRPANVIVLASPRGS